MSLRFLAAAVLSAVLVGCIADRPSIDEVRVTYSDGLCWTGNVHDSDGGNSVEGCEDQSWNVNGRAVSVVFQKQDNTDEELCVLFLAEGAVVKERCTTASYGVVSLAA